jgi:fructose-1,6-bisphosphatase-3
VFDKLINEFKGDQHKMEARENLKYLKLLAKQYPTVEAVSTEIINLSAIINLPKGTEHFLTDIHGEHEAFDHAMRNASGVVKRKIQDTFGEDLSESDKNTLATLVYYPKEKLQLIKGQLHHVDNWYKDTIYRLVLLCRAAGYKYTRSKVRKALPENFSYIIEELFHEKEDNEMKTTYYQSIIDSIVETGCADEFIISICEVIRRLIVDRLHIIGDIYDRGPGAHIVMDVLEKHHSVDIQWGNHDILWMGAAAGSEACIANALRIAIRYGNLETVEDGYGINLSPLIRFTYEKYEGPYADSFKTKVKGDEFKDSYIELLSRMQKALAIIQFKLEGQIIKRRPEFNMQNRLVLEGINVEAATVVIDGITYPLNDSFLPTIDPNDPYKMTEEETEVLEKLKHSFVQSEKLKKHVKFLYKKGNIHLVHNNNLLYHGCVPLTASGEFASYKVGDEHVSGKDLLDYFEAMARKAYFEKGYAKAEALDVIWYIWCGELSPLFGKSKMATFERYFIDDKASHKEVKNPYYDYRNRQANCVKILKAFGLDSKYSHIINGHVPVKTVKGEVPIKAGGKLIAIDGGFAKAYQRETGIAGYTLIFNSRGMALVSHQPFTSKERAIVENHETLPTPVFIEKDHPRMYVGDTDEGMEMKESISALKELLKAYRSGLVAQL